MEWVIWRRMLVEQLVPHVVGFALVDDERVLLAIGGQPDTLAHLVHGRQVLHPQGVDDAEHDQSLQRPHHSSPIAFSRRSYSSSAAARTFSKTSSRDSPVKRFRARVAAGE